MLIPWVQCYKISASYRKEEASKQSQTLVELAGDLTAMFGGTTESAVQALTGALKGNTSMLDNYGMGVNDATIKTKALEMGLYDGTGTMDLASKQHEMNQKYETEEEAHARKIKALEAELAYYEAIGDEGTCEGCGRRDCCGGVGGKRKGAWRTI